MTLHRLQTAEQNHAKKSVPPTTDNRTERQNRQGYDLHGTRYQRCILPNKNKGRRRMENSIQIPIRTLRIPGNANGINQRTRNIPRLNQYSPGTTTIRVCHSLPRRHPNLLRNGGRACRTCCKYTTNPMGR